MAGGRNRVPPDSMSKTPLILVADDCIIHTQLLEQALAEAGLEVHVTTVDNGRKVVDYLSVNPAIDIFGEFQIPDVLLLDLDMPKMNGFEVLNWIRTESRCKELPIVMLSASNDLDAVRKAYASGANGYLVKPFSDRDYTSLVHYVKRFLIEIEDLPANYK
jgi:CheY-like chemotaxis protein